VAGLHGLRKKKKKQQPNLAIFRSRLRNFAYNANDPADQAKRPA
jgi:hypothetical protein